MLADEVTVIHTTTEIVDNWMVKMVGSIMMNPTTGMTATGMIVMSLGIGILEEGGVIVAEGEAVGNIRLLTDPTIEGGVVADEEAVLPERPASIIANRNGNEPRNSSPPPRPCFHGLRDPQTLENEEWLHWSLPRCPKNITRTMIRLLAKTRKIVRA